jgi:hypothetical protein
VALATEYQQIYGVNSMQVLTNRELSLVNGGQAKGEAAKSQGGGVDLTIPKSGSSAPSLGSTPSPNTTTVAKSGNTEFRIGTVGSPTNPKGPAVGVKVKF